MASLNMYVQLTTSNTHKPVQPHKSPKKGQNTTRYISGKSSSKTTLYILRLKPVDISE